MHSGHILLVEADNGQEALDYVTAQLNGEERYPTWSDYHEVGGRWSGAFKDWGDGDVMAYYDNPTLAEEVIKEFTDYRLAEVKRYQEELVKDGFSLDKAILDYDPNDNEKRFANGMNLWRVYRLAKILQDDWTSDSGVFDLSEGTASLTYFRERLKKNPKNQYLIIVDFHS